MSHKTAIILILYNKHNVDSEKYLQSSDNILIVVDNTEGQDLNIKRNDVLYIPLKHNYGIAKAQNIAIDSAINNGCEYIIFFDQDSDVPCNYCLQIVNAYKNIKNNIPNLFLLGPQVINKQTQREYKKMFERNKQGVDGFIEEREIISSGSCVQLSSLAQVGKLEEKLFIDYVDFEWCWRARKAGLISGVATKVVLPHEVGAKEINYGPYHVIISAPVRYYYQTRNMFLLCRRKYVPFLWKASKFVRLIINSLLFLFDKNYHSNLKYIVKGAKDGLFEKNFSLYDRSYYCIL